MPAEENAVAWSDEQAASFDAHGWLVLRSVVPAERLAALNAAFDRLVTPCAERSGDGGNGVLLLPGVCSQDDVLLGHLYDGVAQVASRLLHARRLRLLQETLLLKPAESNGTVALHQDYAYTGYLDPPAAVSVGLALTDASIENGCLYVIDGSHTWGLVGGFRTFARQLHDGIDNVLSPAQRRHVDQARRPLEVRAGDVTIHHCLTFHGSYRNRSSQPRKAVVAHVFDGECRLVRSRLPPHASDRFTSDEQGRLGSGFPTLYTDDAYRS
jgi:ectoine hydroxylase-related dioxygenase (phytanoyl-CoA dioxygenase family)